MENFVYDIYSKYFSKKQLYRFHKFLFGLSVRGLGLLNYKSSKISGEKYLMDRFLNNYSLKIFFDIGANMGDYSKLLKDSFISNGNNIRILAFEPHPLTFKKLKERVLKNGIGAELYNFGFGSKDEDSEIWDYEDMDGSSHASIYKDVMTDIHRSMKIISHRIKLKTLDTFCAEMGINEIDLLKIDTEGNELSVLKGANDLLKQGKIKFIHFEFNEMNVFSHSFFRDFYDILNEYDLYRVFQNGLILIQEYSPLHCELFAYQNIFAINKALKV